jgi:polyisoprenoid-binding protein YceI
MQIIFAVVLRMSTAAAAAAAAAALGYEFDECVARVEFGSAELSTRRITTDNM